MTAASPRRITGLTFKSEDENEDGMVVGTLTDQDGHNVLPDDKWVTKTTALRVAHDLQVDLDES